MKSYTTRQLKRPRSMTGTLELWVGDGYYNRAVKSDTKKMRALRIPTFPTKTPAAARSSTPAARARALV